MFVEPMYACPLPDLTKNPRAKPVDLKSGRWVGEEKYDGLRIVTEVSQMRDTLFVEKGITSWSRYGNLRPHPEHIQEQMAKFSDCILDGERMAPGKRSYGSLDLENSPDLIYYVFDILQFCDKSTTHLPWTERRKLLLSIFSAAQPTGAVVLAPVFSVPDWETVYKLRDEIWSRDGEGLILKNMDTVYTTGKRPKVTWIKIKKLQSEVFTVIGFIPSRGEINDRGPFAMVKLQDDSGNITAVKTRNDAELAKFASVTYPRSNPHPAIGKRLRCEYQERTPDGSYRHIRWDRWEDE